MKRQKNRVKRKSGQKADSMPGVEKPKPKASRRDFLRKSASGALAVAAVGGVGWYLVEDVMATIREGDLSQIGNGIPAVVQIHDPQCPSCRALQREVRKALEDFADEDLQYLVANIRDEDGRKLASAHGVGHVTLLLFDGKGKRRDILSGPNTSAFLELPFRRHVARTGS